MDKIKCPACGTEVLVGAENCPTCGAPVGAINEDNISGVPIDNHAAIDTMLQGANRLVEQSAALGIGLDGEETAGGEGNGEALQRADINVPLPELSENQKNAMSGGVINLTPGNISLNQGVPNKNNNAPTPAAVPPTSDLGVPGGSAPLNTGAESAEAAPGITLYEMDENGNVIDPNKKIEKKAKKEKVKENKPKSSKVTILLAVVISLAIGLAGGYFGKMFLFPELPTPDCQSFAEKAVSSVVKVIPQGKKLHIAEAYVKDFTSSKQCIFRAFSGEADNAKSEWYRVKLDNDSDQTIRVYLQLDMEEYNRLINSGDSEEQVRASVLMSIQNETDRCIEEAKNGEWTTANAILLNNTINPYTPSEKTQEKSSDNS